MTGAVFSVEKREDGSSSLVLTVKRKDQVIGLTLDLIDAGFDVLYEPGSRNGGYESCVLCNEKTGIRIVACEA